MTEPYDQDHELDRYRARDRARLDEPDWQTSRLGRALEVAAVAMVILIIAATVLTMT